MKINGLKMIGLGLGFAALFLNPCHGAGSQALWDSYKQAYIQNGRVVSLDEGGLTTSEGQGYALLRSVWANDPATFEQVWQWTRQNLQVREDKLFAWKWKDQVLDKNSAADADTDIALALILASRRFSRPEYEQEALGILGSMWEGEVLHVGSRHFMVSGNWSPSETSPTLHVAYLEPYAYRVFAKVDKKHGWKALVESSYDVLRWIYFEKGCELPPEVVFINKATGELYLTHPGAEKEPVFSYDVFPVFWRVAVDKSWCMNFQAKLRRRMLKFFKKEWEAKGRVLDRYDLNGKPLSDQEGLALYATAHSLALIEDKPLAQDLEDKKLTALRAGALAGKNTPYYSQNWLGFDQAFEEGLARRSNP